MKILLLVAAVLAAVLLFVLATATANVAFLARHYALLLGVNIAAAAGLAGLVAWQVVALVRKLRARVFGSRLTLRFLLLLALMAVVPGAVVYTVSVQFLVRSIETWFDVKVDAALEGGISLGQSAIDQMLGELQAKARGMSLDLGDRSVGQLPLQLNRLREQAGVQEAVVVAANGRLLASASAELGQFVPDLPSVMALRQARSGRGYSTVDAPAGRSLGLRVVMPITSGSLAEEPRYLQLRQALPEPFSRSASAVEAAYRDYRELALARQDLKNIYIVTLSLVLAVALLVALALAAILASRMAEPLAILAGATQAVARGDFSRQAPVTSRDELGVLTESFNAMTRQLDEARRGMEANRAELETAKAYLENILANLSAGVLVFDRDLHVSISNHGAQTILGTELEAFARRSRDEFLARGARSWQAELALETSARTLMARGAPLPAAGGGGYVLVFDDITHLIQAQRALAWAEVARRLAHEIKNPLTPIQLSAERLELKLEGRLAREDADALRRATRTIVSQVAALKALVDDFRDYARLPPPAPVALDLNMLVREVLALYDYAGVPIRTQLAPGLPAVAADSIQIRQVMHNLLQNAQDAFENRRVPANEPFIEVSTALAGEQVRLSISDNGGGFPENMMARIFEPYVTTKPRGTGLGLAIVKKIVDEHHGSVTIDNRPALGACVSVCLPLAVGEGISAKAA